MKAVLSIPKCGARQPPPRALCVCVCGGATFAACWQQNKGSFQGNCHHLLLRLACNFVSNAVQLPPAFIQQFPSLSPRGTRLSAASSPFLYSAHLRRPDAAGAPSCRISFTYIPTMLIPPPPSPPLSSPSHPRTLFTRPALNSLHPHLAPAPSSNHLQHHLHNQRLFRRRPAPSPIPCVVAAAGDRGERRHVQVR
jgi:hypothetical protein